MSESQEKVLSILGVGLIGGSLAKAAKSAGLCQKVVGYGRCSKSLQRAVDLGVIDQITANIPDAVKNADFVLLATPVGAIESLLKQAAGHFKSNAVITDVGSTKGSVVEAVRRALGEVPGNFVPGHPIAGTENSGVEYADAKLFDGRRVILTPLENTNSDAVLRVRQIWEGVGSIVSEMAVNHHDEVLAATSHMPHMLAYLMVDTLSKMDARHEVFKYAASGFRDFTRIASSDPVMWRDICLANSDALLSALEEYSSELMQLRNAIEAKDDEYLMALFSRSKAVRDRFC
ncbi:MAG TPA: prephenate dehydrogenase/arogenate dehydrogenase family protein [Gammaproteobacteria bacterium]|nr:prephenate dehydrogenase/arogenate dehydrogenase family protein [Gammaproteobacteria bacterium]